MLLKHCIQYVTKLGKLSVATGLEKGQFSFQSQRRAMSKNVQTTIQLHSFHLLIRLCSKFFKWGFRQYVNWDFPNIQTGFRKGRGICSIMEKPREFQKNTYFCFIDYTKASNYVDHNKLWKIRKKWDYHTTLPASWENCMQVKKQQLELDREQWTGSKLGKEYIKAVYSHLGYLTYMQNTSCKMPGCMKHKLESRLLEEMSITSDMQTKPPLWQKAKRNLRACWWQWKRRVKKLA